jgi:CRP/FNR family transcriptional regulator
MADIKSLLTRLPFWDKLSEQQKENLNNGAGIRTFEQGAIVHDSGIECIGLIYVVSGELRAYLLSEEGREITLYRLYAGDTCILSASCVIRQITFETQISAEADTVLLVVGAGIIEETADNNIYVKNFLYELATERFSEVMWTMQQILFMGFDKRLAVFLYDEYARTSSPEIKMTHEQIARNMGSAREVVSRMLRRFAEEGLVEFHRGTILIKNKEKLLKLIG